MHQASDKITDLKQLKSSSIDILRLPTSFFFKCYSLLKFLNNCLMLHYMLSCPQQQPKKFPCAMVWKKVFVLLLKFFEEPTKLHCKKRHQTNKQLLLTVNITTINNVSTINNVFLRSDNITWEQNIWNWVNYYVLIPCV